MAYTLILGVLLAFGTVSAAGILGVGLAAFVQRRSWPYLLVALALAALFVRAVTGVGYMTGGLSLEAHHLLEHGLDIVMAALVIAAVLSAHTLGDRIGGEIR
ncbi:hypothetical protein [Natronomonas gomsonensis]|uniref:DUF7471 family protein n=1 Tax=Natronomonas gomsonensis TaxID=1046043 RepID=UPI0015BE5141|nr:hypothetical protein [Natronomonas gomsonensis]